MKMLKALAILSLVLSLSFAQDSLTLEQLQSKVDAAFAKASAEDLQSQQIRTLKFKSYEDSNEGTAFNGGTRNTFLIDKKAKVALKAYKDLLSEDKTVALSWNKNANDLQVPGPYCPNVKKIECNAEYPYRSIRGSCNNLENTWWGMKETPYKRLLEPAYQDGVSAPRAYSVTGEELPNPRVIAMTIHASRDTESPWSLLFVFFGQHIAHDITLAASATEWTGKPKDCSCGSKDPDCLNIAMPYEDYYNRDQQCMIFVRSSAATNFDCSLGPREHINLISHWMDNGPLYSNDAKKLSKIRTFYGGLLRSEKSEYSNLEQLPRLPGSTCPSSKRSQKCFLTGEARAEDNAMLVSLNALWLREHNRIARTLASLNPKWDDETLFQETRKIVIGEYQHIAFKEFLPVLLGRQLVRENRLEPLNDGYFTEYDPYRYSQIINEFGAAAYRVFHTIVSDEMVLADKYYTKSNPMDVAAFQFNTTLTTTDLDSVLYGITVQRSYLPSQRINPTVNHHHFEGVFSNQDTKRWSLPALNINRGRDHGFPSYNNYRRLCGLGYAEKFEDFKEIPDWLLSRIQNFYAHPDDIDLFTGLVSEKNVEGGIVGPTGACIISKQFSDLKFGDRFYYENGNDEYTRFTIDQLNSIRKVSMSRLLCDNTEVEYVQRRSFLLYNNQTNPYISCNRIPRLDLRLWQDGSN